MNKGIEITVVVSSKKDSKENMTLLQNINETIGIPCHIMCIQNDGVSLTSVYQDAMDKTNTDIVVFVHDDIEFLRGGWGVELLRMFKEHNDFGIIGVAGSAEFDSNAMWWNYEKKYGQVLHRSEGKSWLTSFSPLLKQDLVEVCVIDGLFMAIHKKRISKGFSKDVEGFNFYDIDFCLSNFLDKKTKIGVTTHIRMAHNSIGALSDNWFQNKEKINNKFKENYPIKV